MEVGPQHSSLSTLSRESGGALISGSMKVLHRPQPHPLSGTPWYEVFPARALVLLVLLQEEAPFTVTPRGREQDREREQDRPCGR